MIFKSSYGNIYYEVYGPEDAPSIVFIHGLASDNKMFHKQVEEFAKDYKIIILNLPGHGKSFKTEKYFDFQTPAKCILELLDDLNISKTNIAGTSLGGFISQYIAYKYPERIHSIAVDGCIPLHLEIKKSVKVLAKFYSIFIRITPIVITKFVTKKLLIKSKESQKFFQRAFSRTNKKNLILLSEGIKREILRGIDSPIEQKTLVAHGEYEISLIKNMCEEWKNTQNNVEYIKFPKVGHLAVIENPEIYNKAVKEFFDRHNS